MRSSLRRTRGAAALGTTLILALGACSGDGGGSDSADDPIVVGISLPLTGDFSEPGKGVQEGYEAWAKITNDKGGLLGRQIELKILDDQSNADRVVADYEQLIGSDKVDLVVGPFSTRLVVPSARVAEEYGMLFVEPAGAAKEVFEQGFKNLFYAAPAVANDHYNHLADYLLALPADQKPKTVAYAAMDDPFAQGTAYGLKAKLEAAGIRTVVDEVYPPNTTDFSSIAAKIASSKADMLVGGSQYQDGVNLIVALQQLNYQPKLAAFSGAPTNPEFASAIGNKTEGVLSPTGYSPDAPYESNKEFVEKFKAQFGKEPEEDQANAYTTGQVVAAAVTAAGCAEQGDCQQKLVDWVHGNKVETVVGPLSWDAAGKPQGAHMIQQWQGGSIKIVLPEPVKEAGFLYPKPAW
ncbi:amino acid ABC transporter substrate-binding protein [Actinoplanes friuliensis]|uniref:Putative branched-chain amino acid ABC transporter substrate-binding protein n=1 Tax=Actinoplanes friuliensis DSM 7358 TaxID=1246995 RepID=U5W1S3_9ACTN|nr:amino acid ABC transporter substrate-binding protein [Actinoplanes friuliensis]AGZ41940.1 putative branched-chain amino acid ABC transporter substrate-binding protein [Actinoplanes friuliensis DSM 7358]